MQNPFTTTFSKAPEYTYIATAETRRIIENFDYEHPSESVYKITGVRGSGKTVILAKIEEELRSDNRKAEWVVLDINPTRDMLGQMAAMLLHEGFGKKSEKKKSFSVSATVMGNGGGFGYSSEKENPIFDVGVKIDSMLQNIRNKKKKLFIGIDEVSRTEDMVVFASEFGRWMRANYPVFLVCTGLYENIQELCNVKNLTFFRRATTIKTEPLNRIRMAEMYKNKLDISSEEAKKMAGQSKGYAYAFQELGVLYFNKQKKDSLEKIIEDCKTELFAYSYEKIWEELSENDRYFISLLKEDREYKREELLVLMKERAANYSMYRDRLIKRGLLDSRHGYISLSLPFFADFVKEYT